MAFTSNFIWLLAAVFLLSVYTGYAEERPKFLVEGRCPIVKIPSGFDAQGFSGTWYRIGGLRNAEEKSVNCTVYDYQFSGSGYNVQSNGRSENFSPVTQSSSLTQNAPGLAQFSTTIRGKFEAEMVVVKTDYNSYGCIFTCYNFRESHKTQFAWILSRTPTLEPQKIALCQKSLRDVGVPIGQLRGTYQGSLCGH